MKKVLSLAIALALGVVVFLVTKDRMSAADDTVENAATTEMEIEKETDVAVSDPENTLAIELASGTVLVELAADKAPNHVARMKELAREGFYDGIVFHRVIDGFMAQTGDPTGTGTGGSGKNIDAEFNDGDFVRGALGMARSSNPNSADSQFFICFAEASHLNGQYTYLGKVIDGMELVDAIKKAGPGTDMVPDPDKMISVKVYADTQ